MPKPTHTPIRSVRVPDPTWAALAELCALAETDRSEVILALIDDLLAQPHPEDAARALVGAARAASEPAPAATA